VTVGEQVPHFVSDGGDELIVIHHIEKAAAPEHGAL
jgi:hypothetical protein